MPPRHGAIAAGHEQTAEAAALILEAGGNAFDAALAGLCAACVAEPILCSLGGGGFLLAHTRTGHATLFDFFVQTPSRRLAPEDQDFYPIIADFGTTQQEFHIGLGAMAVPGMVRGLFDVHRQLGRLPMPRIVEPAITMARAGLPLNRLQAYIFSVVAPIYLASPEARRLYGKADYGQADGTRLVSEGETLHQPELADTLEQLAREGDRWFYEGEPGQRLAELSASGGGHLRLDDLRAYRTLERQPLSCHYRDATLLTNPPPSSGGLLIAFALELLADHAFAPDSRGSPTAIARLARVMTQTSLARRRHSPAELQDPVLIARYRAAVGRHPLFTRGTTHISVIDATGNAAALSLSNGEGCGRILPGTGIMLNNMLGEEDLNPEGFHRWPCDTRVSSMMAPTLVRDRQRLIVTGSGGSNRLRTAIVQTLSNLLDHGLPVEAAVHAPRIHVEGDLLHLEPGLPPATLDRMTREYARNHCWDAPNMFFGGTHTVVAEGRHISGAGDPRRGGVFRLC